MTQSQRSARPTHARVGVDPRGRTRLALVTLLATVALMVAPPAPARALDFLADTTVVDFAVPDHSRLTSWQPPPSVYGRGAVAAAGQIVT